jgi:hypothetical protein
LARATFKQDCLVVAALNPLPIWVNILPPTENINANVGPLPTLVKKLISALLFGLANIVTHVGDGDNYLLMLGVGN